jgi:hypothetical protein
MLSSHFHTYLPAAANQTTHPLDAPAKDVCFEDILFAEILQQQSSRRQLAPSISLIVSCKSGQIAYLCTLDGGQDIIYCHTTVQLSSWHVEIEHLHIWWQLLRLEVEQGCVAREAATSVTSFSHALASSG